MKTQNNISETTKLESMRGTVIVCLRATCVTLVLTGVLYPLLMTGLSQALFPRQAAGSLTKDAQGVVNGSELIGQAFTSPGYFQTRPSAAGTGYDATQSSGSNLGGASAKLRARAEAEIARLKTENPQAPGPIPSELVTASGSGLDPHISPAAARWQLPRVAKARGVQPERLAALIEDATMGPDLGIWGEPRVNVLRLNLALDRLLGRSGN